MADIRSEVTGSVWKIEVSEGHQIQEGDVIMIVESMKMEIPIIADVTGKLANILVKEGESVEDGQVVAVLGNDQES